MGHSSTTITADLYTHVSSTVAKAAAKAIADVIDADSSVARGSHQGVTAKKREAEMIMT